MGITEYNTTTWENLEKKNYDAKTLAQFMGIKDTYDTALPQKWLDAFISKSGLDYHKVLYSSFMIYTKEDYWGTPYSAWDLCQQAINYRRIEWIKDVLADKYAQKIHEDLKRLCGITTEEGTVGSLSNDISNSLNKGVTR